MELAKIIPVVKEELKERGFNCVDDKDLTILKRIDDGFVILQKAKNDDFLVIIHKEKIFIQLPA